MCRGQKGKGGTPGRLNGDLSVRIQTSVVDKRSRFLHVAGQSPTKEETERITRDVESYLQAIPVLK